MDVKQEVFIAKSVAQGLAGRVVDAFVGREYNSLTHEEKQLIIPLMTDNPLGTLVAYLDVKDGVVVRWHEGEEGERYWRAIYESSGYDFETKTWREEK